MAELINASVYKIQPKLTTSGNPQGAMEFQLDYANKSKAISPENIVGIEDIPTNTRAAWQTPGIYGKLILNEGGVLNEYYTSQTVAQLVTAAG